MSDSGSANFGCKIQNYVSLLNKILQYPPVINIDDQIQGLSFHVLLSFNPGIRTFKKQFGFGGSAQRKIPKTSGSAQRKSTKAFGLRGSVLGKLEFEVRFFQKKVIGVLFFLSESCGSDPRFYLTFTSMMPQIK